METGEFEFKSVPLGTYDLSVKKQGFKPALVIIVIDAGKCREPIVLTMEATGPLTLQVMTEHNLTTSIQGEKPNLRQPLSSSSAIIRTMNDSIAPRDTLLPDQPTRAHSTAGNGGERNMSTKINYHFSL